MSDAGPRVFSIEEANALVPQLNQLVGDQIDLAEQIQRLVVDLGDHPAITRHQVDDDVSALFLDLTAKDDDDIELRALKRKLRKQIGRYRDGWQQVEDLGVVVKDPTTGLLDLYGRIDNRLVWLCWRYGEDTIDHYHELDAGFDGRKPLAADVRKRMLN